MMLSNPASSSLGNQEGEMTHKLSFPPGYRFVPTDVELLVHYLKNKNLGHPLPIDMIPECNIYKYNPNQLSCAFHNGMENVMYFFTQRERKYEGGVRPDRKAANGYWKATNGHTKITDGDKIVGYKMSLKFHEGEPQKGEKTEWLMEEYTINEVDPPLTTTASQPGRGKRKRLVGSQEHQDKRMSGFVLCRIHKNRWRAKKADEASDQTNIDTNNINGYEGPQASTSSWSEPCGESRVMCFQQPLEENPLEVDRSVISNNHERLQALMLYWHTPGDDSEIPFFEQPQGGIAPEVGGYPADFSTSNYNDCPQASISSGCTPFDNSEILLLNEFFPDGDGCQTNFSVGNYNEYSQAPTFYGFDDSENLFLEQPEEEISLVVNYEECPQAPTSSASSPFYCPQATTSSASSPFYCPQATTSSASSPFYPWGNLGMKVI